VAEGVSGVRGLTRLADGHVRDRVPELMGRRGGMGAGSEGAAFGRIGINGADRLQRVGPLSEPLPI